MSKRYRVRLKKRLEFQERRSGYGDGRERETIRCNGPLEEKCDKCEYLEDCYGNPRDPMRLFLRLPHFIIDGYLRDLTGAEVKVLLYLCRRAQFKGHNNQFARTRVSFKTIAKDTGIHYDTVRKTVMPHLKELGLINYITKKIYSNGRFKTLVTTEIRHMKKIRRFVDAAVGQKQRNMERKVKRMADKIKKIRRGGAKNSECETLFN